ncbi:hypothetical protein BH09ACT1_BH09ACT1_09310 [soil metagenome]
MLPNDRRLILAIVAFVSLAVGLSGCDNNYHASPISLRLVGDNVEMAVCQDIDAESVRITQSFSESGRPYDPEIPFFVASGAASLDRGDVIVAGGPIAGMNKELYDVPALHPDDILEVYVDAQGGGIDMHSLFGPLDKYPVTSAQWTWIDGTTGSEACPEAG